MDKIDSAFEEELNVLHSIFIPDELIEEKFDDRILLKFQINPDVVANADLPSDSRRYCSLKLEISAKWSYPSTSPEVQIRNPRGITDDQIEILNAKISSFLIENQDQCVLYDVIRIAQNFLTHEDYSLPKLPCCICLNQFEKSDAVYITNKCHHHFHSSCIGRYVQHCIDEQATELDILQSSNDTTLEQICCPICRFPIPFSEIKGTLLNDSKIDFKRDEDAYSYPSTSRLSWSHLSNPIERNFKSLYEKQKLQGGLIDLEEERKRMLITDETRLIRQTELLPSTHDESRKKQATSSSSQRKESQKWQNSFVRQGGYYSNHNNRRNFGSSSQHHPQDMTRTYGNWDRSLRGHGSTSSRHFRHYNGGRTSKKATTSNDKSDDDIVETFD